MKRIAVACSQPGDRQALPRLPGDVPAAPRQVLYASSVGTNLLLCRHVVIQ